MDEKAARQVVLVRAIETADTERVVLSDDDRMYATRSANELAAWAASEHKLDVTPELFLEKRADQILKKIVERRPAFSAIVDAPNWVGRLGLWLPLLAFLVGVLADRITDPHRVEMLSAPLILIILWNLAVYLCLLLWRFVPATELGSLTFGPLSRLKVFGRWGTGKLPTPITKALPQFAADWLALSAPLSQSRASRVFHLCAALFALGAVVSLYARGLLSAYQTGWESTFLDVVQVHAVLTVLFTPATLVFQLPGFSLEEIRSLQQVTSSTSETGARWVHLYAATLLLLVILPRLMLSAASGWRETRLRRSVVLDLSTPYFLQLTGKLSTTTPAVVHVFPYAFTVDSARQDGLLACVHSQFGDHAILKMNAVTAYGEDLASKNFIEIPHSSAVKKEAIHAMALFPLEATPERENHGVFIDQLVQACAGPVSILVDESTYRERIGGQGGASFRIEERVALWKQFCELHQVAVQIVHLASPLVSA